MPDPSVTVLMTVYNGGAYLRSAVASILRQTYPGFEFLIINDCSRDESAAVVNSFADERIRLISNETNLGQTRSLNKGLSLARGRYIARIDADDVAFPRWLEANLALMQAQPQTAVVSCKAVVIDSTGEIRKILNTPGTYEEMILKALTATPLNHVGSLYKTDVITSIGGYDEHFKIAADYELWSKLIRKGIRLASNDEPLVAIRVHERSMSITERGRTDVIETSMVMDRNFKALTDLSLSPEEIDHVWRLCYATDELSHADFQSSLSVLQKAYKHLNPEFAVSDEVVRVYAKKQKHVFYTKRAFNEIEEGQWTPLRTLASDYRRSEGWGSIFSLLWLGTWLGRPVLKQLPRLYECWSAWSTKRKLRHQPFLRFIQ